MFILPGILFGNQLSTAYHALLLSYLAFWMVHASTVRVYGIALYLRLDLAFQVVHVPVRGVGSSSIRTFRERSSLQKASRLQMVTLRQPATTPSLLGHSFNLPIATALQSEVMWLTIHQSYRSRLGEILNYWPWLPPGLLWLQLKRFSPWNFHKLSGLTGIHIDSPFKQMRR